MAKSKHLSTRQLKIIEDLFSSEMCEQAVLNKHNVSRYLFNKWLADETFAEQLNKRITAAYRKSAAYIARCATLAAAKLVQLTNSDKPETARKACLDIISMNSAGINPAGQVAVPVRDGSVENESPQLSTETAGKLLAVLAEQKQG